VRNQILIKNNIRLLTLSLSIIGVVAATTIIIGQFMSTLTPQAVYAPAGGRGDFVTNMPQAVTYAVCPHASDYSICTCDDAQAMQASAAKYYADNQQV